jgi:hypothetical protein
LPGGLTIAAMCPLVDKMNLLSPPITSSTMVDSRRPTPTGLAGQAGDELDARAAGQPASQRPSSYVDQQLVEGRRRVGLRSCHRRSPG